MDCINIDIDINILIVYICIDRYMNCITRYIIKIHSISSCIYAWIANIKYSIANCTDRLYRDYKEHKKLI